MDEKQALIEQIEKKRLIQEIESKRAAETTKEPVSQEGPGTLETIGRMGTQGATLGFGDELGGLIQKGIETASGLMGGPTPYKDDAALMEQGFTGDLQPSAYDAGLEMERDKIKGMREANLGISMASEIGGGLATSIASGGALNPVTEGAIYGFGEGEGVAGRLGGAAIGGVAAGVLGKGAEKLAPLAKRAVSKVGGAISDMIPTAAKEVGSEYANKFSSAIRNSYDAITNHTSTKDVPVLEAMERQKDLFMGDLRLNGKKALKNVQNRMGRINDELFTQNSEISERIGKDILEQFSPLVDDMKKAALKEGDEKLLKISNDFREAINSGDYSEVVNTYFNSLKDYRKYTAKGLEFTGGKVKKIIAAADDKFNELNVALIESLDPGMATTFKKGMSDLYDLHKIKKHLDKSVTRVRSAGIGIPDTMIGGPVGAIVGGTLGGPVGSAVGIVAGAKGSAMLRNSLIKDNALANIKYKLGGAPVSRSIKGIVDLATTSGEQLIQLGLAPEVVTQLSKVATGELINDDIIENLSKSVIEKVPEIFSTARYASELDGKLSDPEDMQAEQRRIVKMTEGNVIEKAKALSALNKNGTIYNPQVEEEPLPETKLDMNKLDKLIREQGGIQ